MKTRDTSHCRPARRNAKTAFQLALLCLLVNQTLADNLGGTIYPRLQNLSNRQQEYLQREQQSDKGLLSTPTTGREEQDLNQKIKRQGVLQRQLQQQHRNKAVTEQQRALSFPDGPARNQTIDDLGRFHREQEAQRLRLKIQRRSWQVR